MSMPSFPAFDPDFSTNDALNMLIASIAAEEKALAEILKGEGQKIKCVVDKHGPYCGCPAANKELLAVNQSVTALLESVADNQMLLKNKLKKALEALKSLDSCGSEKGCCTPCLTQFSGECGHQELHTGQYVRWNEGDVRGECARRSSRNGTHIELCKPGRYWVSASVDAKSVGGRGGPFALTIRYLSGGKYADLLTLHGMLLFSGSPVTVCTGGLVVDVPRGCHENALMLRLDSPECLGVEQLRCAVAWAG